MSERAVGTQVGVGNWCFDRVVCSFFPVTTCHQQQRVILLLSVFSVLPHVRCARG